jgi:hypothetical protein
MLVVDVLEKSLVIYLLKLISHVSINQTNQMMRSNVHRMNFSQLQRFVCLLLAPGLFAQQIFPLSYSSGSELLVTRCYGHKDGQTGGHDADA